MPTTDHLISRAAEGDQRAFAQLYDRFAVRVFGLARRLIVNRAIAEEVTQEVFLELWQNAARYNRAKGDPVNWVLTVTRMRAIDRIRSEDASHARLVATGIREYPEDIDLVDVAVEQSETRRELSEALSLLTPLQREAVTLYYGDRSYQEVAELLGVPVGTVKTRVHDGILKLRGVYAGGAARKSTGVGELVAA